MSAGQARNQLREWGLLGAFFTLFFALGLWQILLIPFFQGPDEQVHYATVQHWADPTKEGRTLAKDPVANEGGDIRTWNYSEEIRESAYRLGFDNIKWQPENTALFIPLSSEGAYESEIVGNNWGRVIDTDPINASGTWSLYYLFTSQIESWISERSILDRLFASRFFSVCLGILTLVIAYLAFRKMGWKREVATLASALIAFQPMFLATASVINIDIVLIFSFTLFFLAATHWLIDGPGYSRFAFLFFAATLGIFSKGPGIVLFGLIALLLGSTYYPVLKRLSRNNPLSLSAGAGFLLALTIALTPPSVLNNFLHLGNHSAFPSFTKSMSSYLDTTIGWNALERTALSYWGNFGWLDTPIYGTVIQYILALELIAILGIIWTLRDRNSPTYLPKKSILLFVLASILLLQIAIRFFDWRIFDTTGQILIGTPGRYFLPNILPHMLIIIAGLGYWVGTKERFQTMLKILAGSMFLLTLYCSWFIILPRYYL